MIAITSTNNINQPVQSLRPESPHLKKKDCCGRRQSLHEYQQQQKYHDDPKRAQEDKLSSKIQSKMKAQERQIGEADKEDEKEQQYKEAVDSLGPYDVICGRGCLAFNNVGNRRFRVLISMNVDRYNNAEGRHRKGLFIGSLVNTLQHQIGVKFFKLKDGELIELTGRQIRQKVGHALRDVLAFQDTQFQQQKQLRKQQTLQHKTNDSNAQSTSHAAKGPERKRPRTSMSPTQATLSSIRSRLNEIRAENDTIRLQGHDIPPPMPFSSTASRNSSNNTLRQNPAQSTTSPIRSVLKRQISSQPNLFPPAGNNMNGEPFDSSSRSLPALSRGHNVQNEIFYQYYPSNDSTNATFEGSTTESRSTTTTSSMNTRTWDHRNSNNLYNRNNRFGRQEREISFSLEGIDLAPIPIDEHQEPGDEVLTMLKF